MILKIIFNIMFPEHIKNILRIKFRFIFESIDRYLMYKNYMKACRQILYPIFYDSDAYKYRDNLFLKKINGEYLKKIYSNQLENDDELKRCFDYIDKFGIDTFCYEDMHQNIFDENDIYYDENKKMYYAFYKNKKLYLKRSIDTEAKAKNLFNSLATEQLPQSPHCYLTSTFRPAKGGIVFDIGCAEGNFVLEVIDSISKAYMFECDEEWIEALEETFKPYKEKICIVPKLVSDKSNDGTITIDEFCSANNIQNIDLIKMDVEGYEKKVLCGSKNMLVNKAISMISVCVYHNFSDEKEIGEMLKKDGYILDIPERYMAWNRKFDIMELNDQIFTHGIIRASLLKRKKM
ncbi:FkbM family methyltransferase [Lacrimispora saccharolytica]|nr:FkbM family methyltransferase [Lacrimispora saccharolytica]